MKKIEYEKVCLEEGKHKFLPKATKLEPVKAGEKRLDF